MEKRIGIAIILMVAVIAGGFAYASLPLTGSQQNTAIPSQATSVAFQNDGNSWKHVVAAFDITNVDGSIKSIYADLWVKPKGTANVDLSRLAGLLPEGTKVKLQTYTSPDVPASQLPQGVTDNKVTTTADPAQGGNFLAALTSRVSALDPTVVTPRNRVVVNGTSFSISTGGRVVVSGTSATPICANAAAGGTSATAQISGPVVAKTPRITIVLPF
jgi:hypothetical protein